MSKDPKSPARFPAADAAIKRAEEAFGDAPPTEREIIAYRLGVLKAFKAIFSP